MLTSGGLVRWLKENKTHTCVHIHGTSGEKRVSIKIQATQTTHKDAKRYIETNISLMNIYYIY